MKRLLVPPLLPLLLLPLLMVPAWAGMAAGQAQDPGSAGVDESLVRSLDGALDGARQELEAENELFQAHSRFENAWRFQTEHYEVRTTHSRILAQDIANGLEQMLSNFQGLLDRRVLPSQRFQVFIYPTIPEYHAFGQSSFYSSFYAAQHADRPVATVYHPNPIWLKMGITHAAFHQFLAESGGGTPPLWIEEGLAAYFSLYWSYDYWSAEQLRLVEESRFIPLDRLLRAELPQFAANPHDSFMELGSLFNYLRWHRPDTCTVLDADGQVVRQPFVDYLRLVFGGGNPSSHDLHDLLYNRRAVLEQEFKEFRFP